MNNNRPTAQEEPTKLLPNAEEEERGSLGFALLDSDAAAIVADADPDIYYDPRNHVIARAVGEIVHHTAGDLNTLILKRYLQDGDLLERAGGAPYITSLTDGIPLHNFDIEDCLKTIRDKYHRRRIIQRCEAAKQAAWDNSGDLHGFINDARDAFDSFGSRNGHQPTFNVGTAANALKPQPEIGWLFRDFLARRWVSIWFGEPGCKKTHAIYDQAVCLAMGEPWLGFQGIRSTVLIVDEESGEQRLLRWLGSVMRAHGAPADIPLHYVSLHGFNLTQDAGSADLEALIAEVKPALVIIDSLADLMLGGDENLVKDTQPVLVRLRRICEKHDCSFEVIHHVNRAGEYRGSSCLKGAVDTMLLVESQPDSSLITFTAKKTRDIIIRPFGATAHFDLGKFWLTESNLETGGVRLGPSDNFVLRFLGTHGPMPISTIMSNADVCSPGTARRSVYRLAELGLIRRINEGTGRGNEATYEAV